MRVLDNFLRSDVRRKDELERTEKPNGDVTEYTMSEEELEAKYGPKPAEPRNPRRNWPLANRPSISKEKYLQLRDYLTDREIVRKTPRLSTTQLADLKKLWGL